MPPAAAVHLDEGLILAQAQGVDAAGNDVLAHARLTEQQDRGVRLRNGVHLAVELDHGTAGEQLRRLAGKLLRVPGGTELLERFEQFLLDAHLLPHLGEHGHVAEEGDAQNQLALRVENRIRFEDQLPPVGNGLHARGGLPRPHDLRVQHHVEPAALDELHHGMPQHLFAGDARDFGMAPVQMHDGPFHVGDADPLFEGVKKLIKILLQHYMSVLSL